MGDLLEVPVAGAGVEETLGPIRSQLGNMVDELGEHNHLQAARQELAGTATGGDHVHELTDFANGLRNSASRLQRLLGRSDLSQALRAQVIGTLGRVSRLADAIERAIQ